MSAWLAGLIRWDVALPAAMWGLPLAVRLLFPNARGAVELLAILLPVCAFCVRLFVGLRVIEANQHHPLVQLLKKAILLLGLFAIVVLDAFIVLWHIIPPEALAPGDLIIAAVMYGVYLVCMAAAMYPGRATGHSETADAAASRDR